MDINKLKKEYFKKIDPLDLDLLIAQVLKKDREFVLAHPETILSEFEEKKIREFVERRKKGEPLAYILGHKEFFGLDFKVDRNTLIPRPETELLVELMIEEAKKMEPEMIVDLGTGSGNIPISLAKNLKDTDAEFLAVDISEKALRVARKNSLNHQVSEKINFLEGDLLLPIIALPPFDKKKGILISANLPYLDSGYENLLESSDTRGLKYEPGIALYAGEEGMDSYRKLSEQLKDQDLENCVLFLEIGPVQKPGIEKIFSPLGKVSFRKDLSGRFRIARIGIGK